MDPRVKQLELTLESSRIFRYLVAGTILIAAFWVFYHLTVPKVESSYEKEVGAWQDTTLKLLQSGIRTRKDDSISHALSDSLMLVAQLKDSIINRQSDALQTTKLTFDKRVERLKNDTSACYNLCNAWKVTALDYQNLSDSLITIVKEDSTREQQQITAYRRLNIAFSSETMRADSLSIRLEHIPIYHEEKFLGFIPLPSRKTSLGVGLVTGVLLTTALFITTKH